MGSATSIMLILLVPAAAKHANVQLLSELVARMNAIEQRNRELEAEIDGIKRWQQDQRCGAQVRGDATITAITCSGDTMRLSCAARGGRIVVTGAHYGRTATGTGRPCVGADTLVADLPPPRDDTGGRESLPSDPMAAYSGDKDFLLVDNLTCSLRCDSILRQRVDATCNGRQLCEVNVSTRALGGWDPCKRVLPSGKLCTVRIGRACHLGRQLPFSRPIAYRR